MESNRTSTDIDFQEADIEVKARSFAIDGTEYKYAEIEAVSLQMVRNKTKPWWHDNDARMLQIDLQHATLRIEFYNSVWHRVDFKDDKTKRFYDLCVAAYEKIEDRENFVIMPYKHAKFMRYFLYFTLCLLFVVVIGIFVFVFSDPPSATRRPT